MEKTKEQKRRKSTKRIFGWVPCGNIPASPLLELNFRISGALIDANKLIKAGWDDATGIHIPSDGDGHEDFKNTTEKCRYGSCWLRCKKGDVFFSFAVGRSIEDDGNGGYRIIRGKRLHDTRKCQTLPRLCWARWIWAWRLDPVTSESSECDPQGEIVLPGIDEAIVRKPRSLAEDLSFQTKGFSFPSRFEGELGRQLTVYAALTKDAFRNSGSKCNGALMRLFAPFVRAVNGYDPEGLKLLDDPAAEELFGYFAMTAADCGFLVAFEAFLWLAYHRHGADSPSRLPWTGEWDAIMDASEKTGNWDLMLLSMNTFIEKIMLPFPTSRDGLIGSMRKKARHCCQNWLNSSGELGRPNAINVFLRLIENAKRLPPIPYMPGFGDKEFDALALIGHHMHERACGKSFGESYREAMQRAASPSTDSHERMLNYAIFDAFATGIERELLKTFPNPVDYRRPTGAVPISGPAEGMTHNEIWRWLGTRSDGAPVFAEDDAMALWRSSTSWQRYNVATPFGKARRKVIFEPGGGEVEIFNVDLSRKTLGVIFIVTRSATRGERVVALPQIPTPRHSDAINYSQIEYWLPWMDESCAYVHFWHGIGGHSTAVNPFFADEFQFPKQGLYYEISIAVFANAIVPHAQGATSELTYEARDKFATFADYGTVTEDTRETSIDGMPFSAASTRVAFETLPFAIDVYHRSGLRFEKGAQISVKGWLMGDPSVNVGIAQIGTIFKKGDNQ